MLTKLKSKVLRSIKNKKLNVFGLFLILTFAFLALTKLSKKYTENIALDFTYVNLPEQRVITLDSSPKCYAVVSDYGFNLLSYHFKKHSIQIDFSKDAFVKDSHYVWVTRKNRYKINAQLGAALEVISIEPDTIIFPFETLFAKKVPVVLNSKISFKSGYDTLNNYSVKPDSVNVIGTVSEVSQVTRVETEVLNLKDVSSPINKELFLKKLDKSNLKFSTKSVNVSAKVEKFTEGTLEVPISIVNKPLDVSINYFPKTIKVYYYVSLNNYKNIKPLDFKVECDFSEIANTNTTFFTPKLVKTPELVKNVRMKQNKVEFILMQ
ncbi:YbbR-like domain-containing protein [Flavobacteriaceae bacterium LMO-SS05]